MTSASQWDAAAFERTLTTLNSVEKDRAYSALTGYQRKILAEWRIFNRFAAASSLDIDPTSIRSTSPPYPDIFCNINRGPYYFELGRIEDENLARTLSEAEKRREEVVGGFFSQEKPLDRMIRKKCAGSYVTNGNPVDLLLYYDRQYPHVGLLECKHRNEAAALQALVSGSAFKRIWVYSDWDQSILCEIGA